MTDLYDMNAIPATLRVLHLEDNILDHELVKAMLEEGELPWPCDVIRVDTEDEFRTALSEFAPHIVLSDYSLPNYDGLSAFEFVRKFFAHMPFVIVTGAMGEEVAVETLRKGVTDYVLKQRLERLVPAVVRALQEAAERARRERAEAEIRELNMKLQTRLEEVERLNRVAEDRRQKLEETARQLEEALKLQKTFLAETSHELRTPLTALLGYLRRAEREIERPALLSDPIRVAENMTRLVNDLLQLSRGELVANIEPHFVALSVLLQQVGRDYGVRVQAPEHLELVGDPVRLTQVFVNLVTNAIRVCGRQDLVSVVASTTPGHIVVDVVDHGPGVPDEVKPRIFDKFYRGKEAGSAGLGLTIAQQVVTAHGGHIDVLDTPGGGATFRVVLNAIEDDEDDEVIVTDVPEDEHSGATLGS
ncbi:hybrid sensor histidine kinase/response regulator [Deinococcus pimensis]|uniref:hybrid sensor histidine kinase/response regulator n=1 Tax=Deinococcus pimensis TaxID=309888 RepID=UPI0004B2E509|nr:hybrid sensor histidine kinase/response regulator [Deinococcus pimensis]